MNWLSIVLWKNEMESYLLAMAATFGVIVALWLLRRIMVNYFSRQARESDHDGYDFMLAMAQRTLFPLLLMVSLYAGMSFLTIPAGVTSWVASGAIAAVILQAAIWANALVTFGLNRYQKQYRHSDPARMTTVRAVSLTARLLLVVIAAILILDNLPGVEITALVASLGIGGIAIALAVQSILSDLFASLSIILDKPFVLGDFIIVDSYMGTVEYIGLENHPGPQSFRRAARVCQQRPVAESHPQLQTHGRTAGGLLPSVSPTRPRMRHLKSIPGWIEDHHRRS